MQELEKHSGQWEALIEVGMFPQKIGWQRATSVEQLPDSYRQGSVFISARNQMNWAD